MGVANAPLLDSSFRVRWMLTAIVAANANDESIRLGHGTPEGEPD
jgi:hypothetical protein